MTLNVIGKTRSWFILSGFFIALGIFALLSNGLIKGKVMNFGIDFTGGTVLNIKFDNQVPLNDIRAILGKFNRQESVIQRSEGNNIIISTDPLSTEDRAKILDGIREKYPTMELLEADTIGPVVGAELRKQAFWSLLLAVRAPGLLSSFLDGMVQPMDRNLQFHSKFTPQPDLCVSR